MVGPLLILVTSVRTGLCGSVICVGSLELLDDVELIMFVCGVVVSVISVELLDVRLNMFVRSDRELIEGVLVL